MPNQKSDEQKSQQGTGNNPNKDRDKKRDQGSDPRNVNESQQNQQGNMSNTGRQGQQGQQGQQKRTSSDEESSSEEYRDPGTERNRSGKGTDPESEE